MLIKTRITEMSCKMKDQNSEVVRQTGSKTVLGLDVGTTTIKAIIINEKGEILGKSFAKTEVIHPEPHLEEIDPDELWRKVKSVLTECMKNANVFDCDPDRISCMGLCTLRSSFTTWSKQTGKPFHNIITWKDRRAEDLAKEWDSGMQLKLLRLVSGAAYLITRNKAHQLNSNYHLDTTLCNIKLAWVLKNISEVKKAAQEGDLMFGTLDTWLIYKLSGEMNHVTEASNVISTGLWDMFIQDYSERALNYFDIPKAILPKIVDSGSRKDYGVMHDNTIYNNESACEIVSNIPITAVMADQGASAFGTGCFQKGDIKVTLGTGTFLNMNTKAKPHCSFKGLWPLISWKVSDEVDFFVEGHIYGTSASIEWGQNMGFYQNPKETSDIAFAANELGDLCFVPGFHGLQEPFTDPRAGCGLIGLKSEHGKKEMTRAILESIAFGVKAIVERVEEQIDYAKVTKEIKIDGGISNNDFVLQLIADLTNKSVIRMPSPDMSVIGVAFMAGIQSKVWGNQADLKELLGNTKTFSPLPSTQHMKEINARFKYWKRSCQRFASFHKS